MRSLPFLPILLIPLATLAEPGPMPRAVRPDFDGDYLPDGAIMRLGSKRFRELSASQVTVSPNGESAVCWDNNGLRVWSLADGKLQRSWAVPTTQPVRAVTSDGRFAVTTPGATIELWDTRTSKRIARKELTAYPYIRPVAINPDGSVIAFADLPDYQGVWLWDIATDRTRYFGEHKYDLNRIQFFGNGKRLLAWTPTGETSCWDVANGKQLWTDTFGGIPVGSGDGRVVVGTRRQANFQSTFAILDADTGAATKGVIAPPFQEVYQSSSAISDDGRLVVGYAPRQGGLIVWDTKDGKIARRVPYNQFNRIPPMAFAPDGKSLVTVDRSIEIWDPLSDKKLGGARPEEAPADHIRHLAWSPDGQSLVARAGYGTTQYLWNTRDGRLRFHLPASGFPLPLQLTTASQDPSHWLTFEVPKLSGMRVTLRDWRDGTACATSSAMIPLNLGMLLGIFEVVAPDHRARMLFRMQNQKGVEVSDVDWSTGKLIKQTTLDFPTDFMPAISPDGRFLFGGGRLVDVGRMADSPPLQPLGERVPDFSIRADGAGFLVATALRRSVDPMTGLPRGCGDVAIYERHTGGLIRHISSDELGPLFALSSDGRTLAALAEDSIRFFDVQTGKEIGRYRVADTTLVRTGSCGTALCFSPDGRRLAVGHGDATVVIWESPNLSPRPSPPTAAELDRLWADLASPDAKTGWAAVIRLADSPAEAVPFLADRLKPIRKLPTADVERLISDLDSKSFRTREQAAKRARDWGDPAKVVVEEALLANLNAEMRQRLESLTKVLAWQHQPIADDLRRLRALAVLEQADTKQARAKLDELAGGLPGARVTQEAMFANRRMEFRRADKVDTLDRR